MGIKYIHLVLINLIGPFGRTMVWYKYGEDMMRIGKVCSRMEGGNGGKNYIQKCQLNKTGKVSL